MIVEQIIFALIFLIHSVLGTDPEAGFTVPQQIAYYNYPVEVHSVTTSDGYILELHRIPRGRDERPAPFSTGTRPVVFFMHGLLSDSSSFVLNPPASSAAYVLADAGFDVWLGNVRGTQYGLKHTSMNSSQKQFWDFTWYEHAFFDLPASLDYALNITGQDSAYYIGHSQGTVEIFARLADDFGGAFAQKIRAVFALGPIGGLRQTLLPMRVFATPLYDPLSALLQLLGGQSVALPAVAQLALSQTCTFPLAGAVACQAAFALLQERDEKLGQLNASRTGVYFAHYPSTTSTLNILHWAQIIRFHSLKRLDMGQAANLQEYGQATPPEFDLSTITTPTYLYYSEDDTIADAADARQYLIPNYGPGLKASNEVDHFTHLDFIVGMRAVDVVYRPIIQTIYGDMQTRSQQG